MIKVFNATDTDYSSNGDAVIVPTKARVINSDNGDYYLELICGTEYNDYIKANNIIIAPTPQGEQAFRIRSIDKTKKRLSVKAWHVFYDTQNYLIADSYAVNKTCNEALDHFNAATDTTSPFTMYSDIESVNSYRCVRTSLAECITTILERWGGHLVRDNWNISILSDIGVDNGVTITYKKNLQELTASYDWSSVVTKLMPVGRDGILLDEKYIYSEIQYDIPYTKCVTFEQDIEEDDYKNSKGEVNQKAYEAALKADLLTQARKYINTYCYPIINYTLKGNPEKVTDIGDTIEVVDERIGVRVMTEVISYEYDAIQGKYVSLEFGNFTNTLSDLIVNITNATTATVDNAIVTLATSLTSALNEAQRKIWNALTSSYCIFDGDKILIVDRLPANEAINVLMLNDLGISFSSTGINGNYTTAWSIDGTFNAEAANIINFTADLIKGGILKIGSVSNQNGKIDVYDEANTLICTIDKDGLIMRATNGSYVVLNQDIGLAGYDANDELIFSVENDSFKMSKSVVEKEVTLCSKVKLLPMQITENNVIVNDGIGIVSYYEE